MKTKSPEKNIKKKSQKAQKSGKESASSKSRSQASKSTSQSKSSASSNQSNSAKASQKKNRKGSKSQTQSTQQSQKSDQKKDEKKSKKGNDLDKLQEDETEQCTQEKSKVKDAQKKIEQDAYADEKNQKKDSESIMNEDDKIPISNKSQDTDAKNNDKDNTGKQLDALLMSSVAGTASALEKANANQSERKNSTEKIDLQQIKEQNENINSGIEQIEKNLKSRPIRIHFYLGPVVRTEIVLQQKSKTAKEDYDHFIQSKVAILKLFGILLDGRDRKSAENYVLKHINGGVITSTQQLNNDDRVMILLKESLMQSSGTITPATHASEYQFQSKSLNNAISCNNSVKFNEVQPQKTKERDQFLKEQYKGGHFSGFNKLFKQEQAIEGGQVGIPGVVGTSIGAGVSRSKGKQKKDKKGQLVPADMDEDGNLIEKKKQHGGKHVDQSGEKVVYKSLLQKRVKREDEDDDDAGQPNAKNRNPLVKQQGKMIQDNYYEEPFGKFEFEEALVKKIDYDSLELMLYQNRISDYHDLVDKVNLWAVNLGFLMKLRRPPKMNTDGSKTLRLYCSCYKKYDQEQGKNDSTPFHCKFNSNDQGGKNIKNPESPKKGYEQCPFALTFKLEERQDQWLLYQEYKKSSMTHNHRLEKVKYDDIRQYINQYNEQVKSLTELKELIYHKFGLEYSLNQINYFQGKGWTQQAILHTKEEPSSDEAINFVRLLKKYKEDHLYVEYDKSKKGGVDSMFYSSVRMRETYLRNQDMLFINKRLAINRFGKSLILFLTVSNTGKSSVVGIALVEAEEHKYFQKIVQQFCQWMHNVQPDVLIIERHLKLYQALKESMPKTKILFDYQHIQKMLKTQYQFLEKDRTNDYNMITDLSMIDTKPEFDKYIHIINAVQFQNDYHKLVIKKLVSEREHMAKYSHMRHFTGGISVCQRNEQIKAFLKPAIRKRDCAVSEVLKRILQIDSKEFKLTSEFQVVSQKHEQIFRNAIWLDHVKNLYSQYAYFRAKWNIAKGFRYEISKETTNEFTLTLKQTNTAIKRPWQISTFVVRKVVNKENGNIVGAICQCAEYKNSGFPCPHLCLLNYKGKLPRLDINKRWLKNTDISRQLVRETKTISQHYAENSVTNSQKQFEKLMKLQNDPTLPASRGSVIDVSLQNSQITNNLTQLTGKNNKLGALQKKEEKEIEQKKEGSQEMVEDTKAQKDKDEDKKDDEMEDENADKKTDIDEKEQEEVKPKDKKVDESEDELINVKKKDDESKNDNQDSQMKSSKDDKRSKKSHKDERESRDSSQQETRKSRKGRSRSRSNSEEQSQDKVEKKDKKHHKSQKEDKSPKKEREHKSQHKDKKEKKEHKHKSQKHDKHDKKKKSHKE